MSVPSNQLSTIRDIGSTLRTPAMQQQIASSLPPSVSVDRFTATTITAINHNPDLLGADRQSLYNAVVKAAQDGLLPDGVDGVLNIYNTKVGENWVKKVQWQRMVGGIIKQFGKAGINAYAVSVYANDKFEMWNDGDGQHVKHTPVVFGDRGDRIGALAVAKLANGRTVVESMNMDDLSRAQAASKSKDKQGNATGPWRDWPERMEQKSVLHRLRKRVAVLDEAAAQELNKIDDEFEDEPAVPQSEPERQAVPTDATARPAALSAVLSQADAPQQGDIV